ncbi:MAG: hypothetical protein JKY42_10215 [Flavobacteriales bacterium]|nr:hypothetical protein [Flavobacteriales bacterium]
MVKLRYILIAGITIITIAFGFIRDSLFKHINYQIYQLETSTDKIIESDLYQLIFKNLSLDHLHYSKWILTIAFMIIYYALTTTGIRLIYNTKKYDRLILIIFSTIFVVSGLSYIIGDLSNNLAIGYRFSRLFMGAIQSPFILLILIPGIKFFEDKTVSLKD